MDKPEDIQDRMQDIQDRLKSTEQQLNMSAEIFKTLDRMSKALEILLISAEKRLTALKRNENNH